MIPRRGANRHHGISPKAEELVTYRFPSGSMGLASPMELEGNRIAGITLKATARQWLVGGIFAVQIASTHALGCDSPVRIAPASPSLVQSDPLRKDELRRDGAAGADVSEAERGTFAHGGAERRGAPSRGDLLYLLPAQTAPTSKFFLNFRLTDQRYLLANSLRKKHIARHVCPDRLTVALSSDVSQYLRAHVHPWLTAPMRQRNGG